MASERYVVGEIIGKGGMGVVHRAYHPGLDRYVAIKYLTPALSNDREFTERFLREARSNARVVHQNVVTVYDSGIDEKGTPFIVMELLEGSTLRQRLSQGPVPVEEADEIVSQILAGLAASHALGIVHRDVKPGNIFLCRDGTAKIMDFGVAKSQHEARLTTTGTPIGTAEYMAPEQALGQDVDARTDLYGVGVVYYEMLAGRPPFQAENAVAVLHMNVHAPVPTLPGTPRGINEFLQKALAKDPGQRFQSAKEMARALQGNGTTNNAARPSHNRPTAALLAAGALLLVLVSVGLSRVFGTGSPSPASSNQPLQVTQVPTPGTTPATETPIAPAAKPADATGSDSNAKPLAGPDKGTDTGTVPKETQPGTGTDGQQPQTDTGPATTDPSTTQPPQGETPPPAKPDAMDTTEFKSDQFGFTLQVPVNWHQKTISPNGRTVFLFDNGVAELRVDISPKSPGPDMIKGVRDLESSFKRSKNHEYVAIGLGNSRFACHEAVKWDFVLKTRPSKDAAWGALQRKRIFYLEKGGRGYAVLVAADSSSFGTYANQFAQMLNSFAFVDEPCTEKSVSPDELGEGVQG
jgi:serine/threonine-protein kinase